MMLFKASDKHVPTTGTKLETVNFIVFIATLSPTLDERPAKVRIPANIVVTIPTAYFMIFDISFTNLDKFTYEDTPFTAVIIPQKYRSGYIILTIKFDIRTDIKIKALCIVVAVAPYPHPDTTDAYTGIEKLIKSFVSVIVFKHKSLIILNSDNTSITQTPR